MKIRRNINYPGVLKRFQSQFYHLKKKGLKINGIVEIDFNLGIMAIDVSHPFVFDNRALPQTFEDVDVRAGIEGELPEEFKVNDREPDGYKNEYRWAPERFEAFVSRAEKEIKEKLGDENMSRDEILDAICFGNFKQHKERINKSILEGIIPEYRKK